MTAGVAARATRVVGATTGPGRRRAPARSFAALAAGPRPAMGAGMTSRTTSISSLLLLLSLAAACGSVEAGPGEGDGDGDGSGDHRADAGEDPGGGGEPGDPPEVVSISPEDGAAGVRPDAVITVRFSRAMEAGSVESAWRSAQLPAAAVTFGWNAAGDTLTVTPAAPLPVAEGSDPDVLEPARIAWGIDAGARDGDGVALAGELAAEFTTVRRITADLAIDDALTDSRLSSNAGAPGSTTVEYAGDTSGDVQVKLLVSFALPGLPAGAELEGATLSAEQVSASANLFNGFGDLEAFHVRFAQITSGFGAGSLGSLGIFSASGTAGARSLEVTSAVADDLDDGVARAQFRLELPLASDGDGAYDTVQFERASLALRLVYLAE